jgi:antitoxin CptB
MDQDSHELSRLRWRCRRGMRELDELLLRYVERRLPGADRCELDAFACLLELPDPELYRFLAGPPTPDAASDPKMEQVAARIRNVEP